MAKRDIEAEYDAESASLKPEESPEESEAQSVGYFHLYYGTPASTKVRFAIGASASFLSGATFSNLLYLMGQIFDEATDEEEDDYDFYHETRKIALIWIMLGCFMVVFGFVSSMCFTRISQDIGRTMRKRYFSAILRKDISYFDQHNVAELPGKLSRDCDLIEGGVGDKFMSFIEVLAFVVMSSLSSISKSPQLFLVGLAIAPVILGGNAVFGYAWMMGTAIKEKAYIKAGAIAEESLADIKTVASFNAQNYVSSSYNEALKEPIGIMGTMGFLKSLGWALTWGGWMLMGGVILWVPAKWISDERRNWIWEDDIEGPDAIVVYWELLIFCMWLGQLAPGIAAYLESKVAGGRAFAFIDEPVTFVNGTQDRTLEGQIEFKSVHFAYPKHPDVEVLKGLSFVCEKGQKTAIVGESGAGKSTIIQLMERFYEPHSGLILYDGVPVAEFEIGCLRKQVALVSQEPVLFNLSIEDNIRLSNPSATDEDIESAAKQANVYDFVFQLEQGLKTNVGVRGSRLSGGQKQRVAIARALVRKPKILLLDEATSALDNASEELVLRALNHIHESQHITMISVAQKLSTIRSADKIVVLRDGKAEEEGTHDDLMAKGGLYSTMYAAQGPSVVEAMAHMKAEVQEAAIAPTGEGSKVSGDSASSLQLYRNFPLVRIVASMLPYWPLLVIALLSTIVAGAMYPTLGYLQGKAFTYISGPSGGPMEHNVRKFCIWMLICTPITFFAFLFMGWTLSVIATKLTLMMREKSFIRMLHLDAGYFDDPTNNSALLSQNLNHDVELINDAGGPMLGAVLIVIVAYVCTNALDFYWQWKLALCMLFVMPVQAFGMLRAWMVRISGIAHPQHQTAAIFAMDSILNVKTLKAYHMQEEMENRYEQFLTSAFNDTQSERIYNALWYGTGLGTMFWGLATSFWYGAYLEKYDEADSQSVNIICMATFVISIGIASCVLFAPGVPEASRAATRIYSVLDYKPNIDSMDQVGLTTEIIGHVAFNNVSFLYKGRDNMVLLNTTFELPAGKRVGITGASGSGKTTLTQLILRFYDVTEGSITVDGIDVRNYNIRHLRSSIAMVGQEPVLFSGTVRNNVDFGLGKSDEEIKEALVKAAIPRFADQLDREVGNRGSSVSGGQKQRIAIARAILRSPKILLLDEATSALDSKTEKKILQALEQASEGKTVLIIAHRLSTIEKCDEIMVMDGGVIKEKGTHEELKSREGSIYQKLLKIVKND